MTNLSTHTDVKFYNKKLTAFLWKNYKTILACFYASQCIFHDQIAAFVKRVNS